MAKRLVKVAKELNIGTSTIVDHLRSKGFEIENRPIAKITDAMEAELRKEFAKAIAIKEQADSLVIGTRPVTRKEDLPIEKPTPPPPPPPPVAPSPPPPPPPPKVEKKPEPKPAPVPKPEPTPAPVVAKKAPAEPVVESKPKEEIKEVPKTEPKIGLKIKGKINLDRKPTPKPKVVVKKEEPKEVSQPKAPAPKPAEEPKKVEKPIAKVKVEVPTPPKVETPKVVKEEKPAAKQKTEEKPSVEKPSPAPKVEKKADNITAKAPKKAKEEKGEKAPAKEESSDENKPLETIRAATPELRGLKILGKINIEKKPKKKKNKRRKDETGKPGTGATNPDGTPKKEGDNKTTGNQDPNRRRRKRRRVRASSVGSNQNQNNSGGTGTRPAGAGGTRPAGARPGNTGSGDSRNRPGGQRSGGPSRPGDRRRPSDNRRGDRRGDRRGRGRDEVKEVSKKEIEDNIKATMARLSGRGGKKKRQRLARDRRDRIREKQEQIEAAQVNEKLQVTEFVTVSELASLMDVAVTDVIMACMGVGVIVSINQRLDAEIIELVASEFDHEVEFISAEEEADEEEEIIDDPEDLEPRAPIVTVMGHVDHGKTSLLDYIREATVAEGEAGGITQHIGAYEVVVGEENKKITFLDTPGHEAFTAMRARGAKVTDIAIIIIAADDSIMPQTKEAISHSQAAGVPMVFAINKIDKPGANPDRIKQELASMNLLIEEWGGEHQSQDISAKMGTGIDELLEKVLLVAELLELKANPNRKAIGAVLEASLDKGRGYVAKTLVQTGTLSIGDPVVAGEHSGKVKAMFNERGKRIKTAGPSTPVLVLGLGGAPTAGERFKEMDSETEARTLANRRSQIAREQANRATKRISLDEIGRRLALGSFKELNLIIKGDVDGSVEALSDSLIKLSIESVQVNVIHKAVGQIIESDVLLASASDAIIIGFQVRPSVKARQLAEQEGVQVKMYSIIYEAIEEIKLAIEGMLEPTKEEKIVANVEIREIFKISKVGTIAGCHVLDGTINRNSKIRVIRNGIVIYPTKEGATAELASLKRFKDDAKEVKKGFDCGLNIKNYNDIKVGDVVEAYEIVEIKQKLK